MDLSAIPAMVLRWGIVGCGDVTEVKSGPGFRLAKNSQLVAVMRRDGEKAKDYAERHQVPKWYNTLEGILTDPEAEVGLEEKKWWNEYSIYYIYMYIIFGYSCWGDIKTRNNSCFVLLTSYTTPDFG